MHDVDDYRWLASAEAARLLEEFAAAALPPLNLQAALRRAVAPERARLVAEQLELRRRAVAKFGEFAPRMLFTRELLAEATDLAIARQLAERFADAETACDYCCGLGGDLAALAELVAARRIACVEAWDCSPLACLLAEFNAAAVAPAATGRLKWQVADVAAAAPPPAARWRIDPERRRDGRRATAPELYSPPAAVWLRWFETHPHGLVKLAPAASLPLAADLDLQAEWISRNRECRQLVLTGGTLRRGDQPRRATRVAADATTPSASFGGAPDEPLDAAAVPGRYLCDPDPALVAARLVGAWGAAAGLRSLGPGGVYLTGDALPADVAPLASWFAVEACLPLRVAAVRDYLRGRRVGQVEVKTRGVDVDLQKFARAVRSAGDAAATVFLTRAGAQRLAIVATRLPHDEAPPAAADHELR